MNIAVCFKVVPDFDQVVEADWKDFSLSTGLAYVKRIFGCFDEGALETALRLRSAWKEQGEDTVCTALTAAPLPAPFCKTLFAAGFDRVVDISGGFTDGFTGVSPEAFGEFQPRRIAAARGNFLSSDAWDLILTGGQAGWADTGTVPLLLAEILEMPVLTGVEELIPGAGGIEVIRTGDAGRERLRVRPPLLAALGNGPAAALRAVTLGERMAASGRTAEKPALAGTGGILTGTGKIDAAAPRFCREERRKVCRFLPGGADLARSAAELHSQYLKAYGPAGAP
jgi:electron transfer flavoprotein alpha/beta subunit